MSQCIDFAKAMAKIKGISYTEATKRFPKGPDQNTVYITNDEYMGAHCVHCARTDAMAMDKPGVSP